MVNHDRWRDWQLTGIGLDPGHSLLPQEQLMLEYVQRFPNVVWRWLGPNTKFKEICQQYITLSESNYQGIVLFGPKLLNLTTGQLVSRVQNLLGSREYAYVAVNRYELVRHDLSFELPDSIEHSIDAVMQRCHGGFLRLHTFEHVDGQHMVAAHPMDCYGLCKQ